MPASSYAIFIQRLEIDGLLVPDTLQRSVKSLLFELFPGLRGPRTGTSGSDVSNWRNECRVCSSTVFDRYFLLAVPRNTLAETDVDRFFEVLDDREPVSGLLQDTIKLGKARALLERIDDRIQEMPESKIRNLVQLMADHSEELVFPRRSTSDVSYNIMPMLVIIRGIRKLETDDVRIQTCIDIIRDCKSLHTVARLVSWINSLQHEDQSDQIILDQKKLEAFRNVASEQL